jgi:hypothetical protein
MLPELPEWPSAWEMTDESGASNQQRLTWQDGLQEDYNQQRLTWQDGLQEDYIQPIVPFIHEELETGDAIYRRF